MSVLLLLAAAGCGYRLAGTEISPPGGIRSLSVGTIDNDSRQFGIENRLAFAFERELHRRGLLRLADSPETAEAVLSGRVRRFETRPVAFDAQDRALQYEAQIVLDLALRRTGTEEILWSVDGLTELADYSVASRVVVPSSSQFQRGTLAVEDLRRLTDIQLAETEKRLAVEELLDTIARDIHDRLLEDF